MPKSLSAIDESIETRRHSSLKAAGDRQVPIEQTLEETGINVPSNETIRLGELLVIGQTYKRRATDAIS